MLDQRWTDGFFVTQEGRCPAEEWLLELPDRPAARIVAVVRAVRDAPPTTFAGGGMWEAMHGAMTGIHEVRVRVGKDLHRLFCLLDRDHPAGPILVMLDGRTKSVGTALDARDYRSILALQQQYRSSRAVDVSGA